MKIGFETRGTEISGMREQGRPSQKAGSEGAKERTWGGGETGQVKKKKGGDPTDKEEREHA